MRRQSSEGDRERRLHPVVAAWISGGGVLAPSTAGSARPEPAVAAVLRAYGSTPDDEDPAFESLDLAGVDPDLTLLVLAAWAAHAEARGRAGQIRPLYERARLLCGPGTPPEVADLVLRIEQRLPEARGDVARREAVLRRRLALLGANPALGADALLALGFLLAEQGRARELEPALAALERDPRPACRDGVDLVRFVDRVRAGRVEAAAAMRGRIEHGAPPPRAIAAAVAESLRLVRYLRAALRGGPLPATAPDAPDWEQALAALLARRVADALALARRAAAGPDGTADLVAGQGIASQVLIRAELAAGNGDTARRLLERRYAVGNRLPFDAVLEARLTYLAGDHATTHARLVAALAEARRLDAMGRVGLELALAPELPVGVVADLASAAPATVLAHAASPAPAPPASAGPPRRGTARLIGSSPALAEIRARVAQYAALDVPVLILGETGTGKEEVARALHEAGPRAREPFIAVNCAAIPHTLIEAELFGHVRGAFTGATAARAGVFEAAGAGTLLLDEIGEMPVPQQARLLRVLETREVRPVGGGRARPVRCRVLAATNRDPERAMAEGVLRADLLYRLRRLEIRIPPLRWRPEDALALARHFLSEGRPADAPVRCAPAFEQALAELRWPGNVRELRAVVERLRLLGPAGGIYEVGDLRAALGSPATGAAPGRRVRPPARRQPAEVDAVLAHGRSRMRRQERLGALFDRQGRLTRAEVAEILGVSGVTASADLRALIAAGRVRKVTPNAAPRSHYFERTGGGP